MSLDHVITVRDLLVVAGVGLGLTVILISIILITAHVMTLREMQRVRDSRYKDDPEAG